MITSTFRNRRHWSHTAALTATMLVLGACANMTPTQQRALSGGAIGATGGAVLGALTGGSAAAGAAIGGAAGVATGLLLPQ